MIRPTRRLLALAALMPVLGFALILIDDRLWVLATGLTAALPLLALWDAMSGLRPQALRVTATAPGALPVGLAGRQAETPPPEPPREGDEFIEAPETLKLEFEDYVGRAAPEIEALLDANDILHPPEPFQFRLDADGFRAMDIPLAPRRRGEARLERLWLRWKGPFGLSWIQKTETLDLSIPAIPDLRGVRRAALALDRRSALSGLKPQITGGDGADFDALKEYQAGMDRRSVDWKRSARHRKLVVKEFQAERNHNVVIALDCGHLMREPLQGAPKIDHAVNAGLTVAYQALAEGDRAGLFAFDSELRLYHPPRPGKSAFPALQRALAGVDYRAEETNFTLGLTRLAQALDRRSIIVLITDFLDTISAELMTDALTLLSRRHMILFVALKDPGLERVAFGPPEDATAIARAVAATEIIRERRTVLERLRRHGIDAMDVAPEELDSAVLSRFLRAKRRSDPEAA